ncbi:hypothetical protein F4861DRAFT_550663 [Xylaria intraflava]|nr:hypothetical protein F4861DRAFT_550663 [Xylaria intraflava]
MAEPEGHSPSALTPQTEHELFYQTMSPPDVVPTQVSGDSSRYRSDFPPLPERVFGGVTAALPPLAPEDDYRPEGQLSYTPVDGNAELPSDIEEMLKSIIMPPPPLPQPTIFPIINLAVTTSGGFKKNSPLHKWIVNNERNFANPSDTTQTRLVNTICEVLADPAAGSSFIWRSIPDNESFVRVDVSLWIGNPDARGNWKKLNTKGGWQTEYVNDVVNHVDNPRLVEHVGDPRVCEACRRASVIKQMRSQIEELKAKVKMLEEELGNERVRGRPAKRRRKEPAQQQEQVPGPIPRGRGGAGRAGRGRRGGSHRRGMALSDALGTVPLDPALQPSNASVMSTLPYPDTGPTSDTVFPPDVYYDPNNPWDFTA